MAKKRQAPKSNTSSIETNTFIKGMVKDFNPSYTPKQNWTNARNAANNSIDGDTGMLGNEPANLKCAEVPYTIIGTVHQYGDQWVLYSTDNTSSEIGLFDDSKCEYNTLVNDDCLSFNKEHLIIGASKENFDCTWQVYWDDGVNPSRTLNLSNVPYKKIITSAPGADCITFEFTDELDCEQLRLAPLLDTPNIKLTKAIDGGQLRNGSYQAFIAYVQNEQKVTDYIGISNIQSLFSHENTSGALDLEFSNLDEDYEFFELVILSNNQSQYVAKRIGLYSTKTLNTGIDFIDPALPTIPLEQVPLRNPAYERSDAMYVVNDYLIRQGPTEQFDFNYQPLANQIDTKYVVAEYNAEYYYKGVNKTNFMRDEQYAFFIRWVYNTGERSNSYHIPGRAPNGDDAPAGGDPNALATNELRFQVFNTAFPTNAGLNIPIDNGQGEIIEKGRMGYWQSTERYPDQQPEIWNATSNSIWGTGSQDHDLCGKFIRHHKMPSEETSSALKLTNTSNKKIRVLGVEFNNIKRPLYNDGTIIENIVGYEILRGSREGAKSILGKGIFRNMRKYDIPNSTRQGLYPNYPYNDLGYDEYFHNDSDKITTGTDSYTQSISRFAPLQGHTKNVFTFHSPELVFKKPFLNAYETRIYGQVSGKSEGQFIVSEKHPQEKLLRNSTLIFATFFGLGYGLQQIKGIYSKEFTPVKTLDIGMYGIIPGAITAPLAPTAGGALGSVGQGVLNAVVDALIDELLNDAFAAGMILAGNGVARATQAGFQTSADAVMALIPGTTGGGSNYGYTETASSSIPTTLSVAKGLQIFLNEFATGANEIIELFYNLVSFQDYALKYNSHGFYNNFSNLANGARFRSKTKDSNFIGSVFNLFGSNNDYKINNLFRPSTIAVETRRDFADPSVSDTSRFTIGGNNNDSFFNDLNTEYTKNISALYGALKYDFENQYGQLDQIKQVPMRGEVELIDPESTIFDTFSTSPIFSGDTYINRYTEKTIMPIFTDFLYGQPEGYAYDYHRRVNIPYPRYWMNTVKYDVTRVASAITSFSFSQFKDAFPSSMFYLDRKAGSVGTGFSDIQNQSADGIMPMFVMQNAYMYTHVNGIQDFFVESEVNLAQRDWEEPIAKRHYDEYEYNDINELFDAQIIRKDNFYRYDYSLSASRFITNLTSFGNVQPRDYDPIIAETCYSYYPKRLIYSLQAKEEAKKDFWRVFLPNNYEDFKNQVTVIKPISKSGALIFFPYQSPQMFQGVDTLQTDAGTKLMLGDGGLFSQPRQNIVNSDISNEYGSCESHRAVLNTPMGIFYISQAQGKIFQYTGQLANLSNQGMKWWFNKYLPSQLLRSFPALEETPLADNPVVGVGCQVIYDINDDVVYFCKRDFKVRTDFDGYLVWNSERSVFELFANPDGESTDNTNPRTTFAWTCVNGVCQYVMGSSSVPGFYATEQECIKACSGDTTGPSLGDVELGDPDYFEDASWTVSYDPKAKAWISFHDWHPELCMSSINNFLTTKTIADGDQTKGSIWRHNSRCDLFANYYGVSYPWEVEFVESTGQNVNTVRSLEYQLESYVYKGDLENGCADDRWHDLNFNFDELIVYNTEQISGKLNLNLSPSFSNDSDPIASLDYPIINQATLDMDILYTKEEQKYRINQFWDVTKDRGEFTNIPAPVEEVLFNTEANGYIKTLNLLNIDILKAEEQRKKFRHYYNKFILRKLESDNRKMLLKLNNTKLNLSMR